MADEEYQKTLRNLVEKCAVMVNNRTIIDINNFSSLRIVPQKEKCVEDMMDIYVQRVFEPYTPYEMTVYSVLYAIVTILGLVGNGLVIYIVLKKKEMRTSANIYITNLAVSNFLLALFLYPFLYYPTVQVRFPFGHFFCKTANAIPGSNIYCSTLTITFMAIDRFYSTKSTTAQTKRLTSAALISSTGIWILAVVLSLPLLLFNEVIIHPDYWKDILVCPGEELCDKPVKMTKGFERCALTPPKFLKGALKVDRVVNIIQTTFLYVIPILVLFVFNIRLMRYLRKNTMARKHSIAGSGNGVGKVSQAMVSAKRRHKRATKLLNAMAVSYGVLWLPFTVISFLFDFSLILENTETLKIDRICKFISLSSICINPFLYGYLNTNFNREFRQIFSRLPLVRYFVPFCSRQSRSGSKTEFEQTTVLDSVVNGTASLRMADTTQEQKTLLKMIHGNGQSVTENSESKI